MLETEKICNFIDLRIVELKDRLALLEHNESINVNYQIMWLEEARDIVQQYRKL